MLLNSSFKFRYRYNSYVRNRELKMLPNDIEDFANHLADMATEIALKYFRQPLEVESKADKSPVSIADKEIEETLRKIISQKFPEHGILGEEFEQLDSNSNFLWVIDPIDGTKSFVTGHPTFGTLISLLEYGEPALGLIEMAALNERWFASNSQATLFNGQAVQTRQIDDIKQAIFCSTGPDFFNPSELPIFNHLSKQGQFRLFGGDCYNYGLLASGFVDVVIESDLKPFDYMALVPIIKNAGGIVTDWEGNDLTLNSSGQILASANESLHYQCLEEIKKAA